MCKDISNNQLKECLVESFNLDELKNLAFDIEVEYDYIAPSGRETFARELIQYCWRKGKRDLLLDRVLELRPNCFTDEQVTDVSISYEKSWREFDNNSCLPYEPETVHVPSGPFQMGDRQFSDEQPNKPFLHTVKLPDYYIGIYPVTNAQYFEFVKDVPGAKPQRMGWFNGKPPAAKLDHPVSGVSWYDAVKYCDWLSKRTERAYRLPSEAEWEKAARGSQDARKYPWGDEPDPNSDYCNCNGNNTTPVDAFPTGKSPYGCYDMIGNVAEWTNTIWGEDFQEPDFLYPYLLDDDRNDLKGSLTVRRIYRGGHFDNGKRHYQCNQCSTRFSSKPKPERRNKRLGFRVVCEVNLDR